MLWQNPPFQHVTVWWRWQGYRSDTFLIVGIDWEDAEADAPSNKGNLWEESWDDDDTSEDFSAQLRLPPPRPFTVHHPYRTGLTHYLHSREELKKTNANKS